VTQVKFVAEVSSNHHQNRGRCLDFVDAAAECGCQAIKFQQFKVRELFAKEFVDGIEILRDRIAWELPEGFNETIAQRAHDRGIEFASTPFYMKAVEVLEPHVDFFKIASYQILWLKLLREVAQTGKPVVLSTGMATMDEIHLAIDALGEAGCTDLTLLDCVSTYPTLTEQANLAMIRTMREEFHLQVGWSDHTVKEDIVVRAVRKHGAEIVEFHFDLEGEGAEFPTGHCWLPAQVRALLAAVEDPAPLADTHPADGDGKRKPRDCEMDERLWRTDPVDGLRPVEEFRPMLLARGA